MVTLPDIDEFGVRISAIDNFSGTFDSFFSGIGNLLKVPFSLKAMAIESTVAIGLLTTALVSTTSAAATFQQNMNKTLGILEGEQREKFGMMTDEVKNLAANYSKPLNDISTSLYDIVQASFVGADAAKILGAAVKSAVADPSASTTQAVNLLTSTLNAFGTSANEVNYIADMFFQTTKRGQTTIPELSASLAHVTPIAAQMGISIEEVTGALSTLTRIGMPTSEAVTYLRSALIAVAKQTPESVKTAKELGISFNGTALKAQGLQKFLENLVNGVNNYVAAHPAAIKSAETFHNVMTKVTDAAGFSSYQLTRVADETTKMNEPVKDASALMNDLFGRVEGMSAALILGGQQVKGFKDDIEAMGKSTGTLDNVLAVMTTGLLDKLGRLNNMFELLKNAVGEKIIPVITGFVDRVIVGTKSILDFENRTNSISKTLISFANGLWNVGSAFLNLIGLTTGEGITSIVKFLNVISQTVFKVFGGIIFILQTLKDAFAPVFDLMVTKLSKVFNQIQSNMDSIQKYLVDTFKRISAFVSVYLMTAFNYISSGNLLRDFRGAFETAREIVNGLVSTFKFLKEHIITIQIVIGALAGSFAALKLAGIMTLLGGGAGLISLASVAAYIAAAAGVVWMVNDIVKRLTGTSIIDRIKPTGDFQPPTTKPPGIPPSTTRDGKCNITFNISGDDFVRAILEKAKIQAEAEGLVCCTSK